MTAVRTAVVTGGGRGIGLAIARSLGREGARVVLVARDSQTLDSAVATLSGEGIDAEALVCDLRDRDALRGLISELSGRRFIQALVNNAGGSELRSLASTDEQYWDAMVDLNLTAAFLLTRGLADALAASGTGAIVNIGSATAIEATPGLLPYGAAKAALHHLTRALAVELGVRGIRVNAIAPGFIRTDLFEQHHSPERQAALASAHPLGRVGTSAEVADVAAFLCGEGASFVNGAVIPVDGGLTSRLAIPSLL